MNMAEVRIVPVFIPITYKHKLKLFRPRCIYFKYSNREFVRVIHKPPESITPILEYKILLEEKYGKKVKLTLVKSKNRQEFLRFLREDGIPLYIRMSDRELFIREKDIGNPITPTAVSFFTTSCGYEVHDYYRRKEVEKWLPFCILRHVKQDIPLSSNNNK